MINVIQEVSTDTDENTGYVKMTATLPFLVHDWHAIIERRVSISNTPISALGKTEPTTYILDFLRIEIAKYHERNKVNATPMVSLHLLTTGDQINVHTFHHPVDNPPTYACVFMARYNTPLELYVFLWYLRGIIKHAMERKIVGIEDIIAREREIASKLGM